MKIAKIMSTRLVTVGMDTTLEVVNELFASAKFHHVLVVDDVELVGVVSDRDLLKALSPNAGSKLSTLKDEACLQKKVHQIMSRDPIVVQQNQSILSAVKIFNQHKISVLPVMDEQGKLAGILSWRDIFRQIEHYYAKPE